jgi:hypothetical protein
MLSDTVVAIETGFSGWRTMIPGFRDELTKGLSGG